MTAAQARSSAHSRGSGKQQYVRWIVVGVAVVATFAGLQWLPLDRWIEGAKGWFEGLGSAGPPVFVALYVVSSLLLVPASAATIAAGSMFGLWLGFVLAAVASEATAMIGFLIARHFVRGRIEQKVRRHERFRALDDAIGEGSFKVVLLLRLSPIVPFGFSNYAMGLTQVGFGAYALASIVGMLPGTFLYVYLGWIGIETVRGDGRSPWEWAFLGVGLAATAVLTWWMSRAARAKLHGKKRRR